MFPAQLANNVLRMLTVPLWLNNWEHVSLYLATPQQALAQRKLLQTQHATILHQAALLALHKTNARSQPWFKI
jgi:hypothetical protein